MELEVMVSFSVSINSPSTSTCSPKSASTTCVLINGSPFILFGSFGPSVRVG